MLKTSAKSLVLAALVSGVGISLPAAAQTSAPAAVKPAPKPAAAKPAPSRTVNRAAPAAAAAVAAPAVLTAGQLEAAERVMTGTAKCEFGEEVQLTAEPEKPGHFVLRHKQRSYRMAPEETSTGAIRLEDKQQGIMWLQIPSKSMLMNSRIGQRMVDDCMMSQQQG
jgi:hypothetical protein